jgi:hypothetical protein
VVDLAVMLMILDDLIPESSMDGLAIDTVCA